MKIPLFPLPNVVLFPGMSLPLHIFEPRYREMLQSVMDQKKTDPTATFGIQLCKTYNPMTMEGTPFDVGTTVDIAEVREMEDGRYYLMTRGLRRYQVEEYDQTKEYLQGTVTYLEEEDPRKVSGKSKLMEETKLYFHEALRLSRKILKENFSEPCYPETPEMLSYYIAENLKGSLVLKQEILEINSTRKRLTRERELLKEVVKTLAVQAQIEEVFGKTP